MSAHAVDLAIVGGGSAGFAAAVTAADLGAKAAIIESGTLGGTCVNVGCVPSKTLLRAAEVRHRAGHHAFAGVSTRSDGLDFGAVVRHKDALVAQLQKEKYLDVLAGMRSVTLVRGRARLHPDGGLEVDGRPLPARAIVIATGASPWAPPIPGLAATPFLTSTEALSLATQPRSLIVVGGGAVGLELAQLFARLGTHVTVLEALPRLVSAEDDELSAALAGCLTAEGLAIHTSVAIERISGGPGDFRVDTRGAGALRAEQLLIATGHRANTRGLGLDEAGVRLGATGQILIDAHGESSRPGIYAAGDVTGEPMFVYVAAHAGTVAAANALQGNRRTLDLAAVPRVTFTDPALAAVGLTEAEARARGLDVLVSKLPMSHVPRALAARDTRGLVKLIADRATRRLVGAHVLAPEAGDIIQEAVVAIRYGISIEDLGSMLHPYLTSAEAIKLAALAFDKDIAKLSCCAG